MGPAFSQGYRAPVQLPPHSPQIPRSVLPLHVHSATQHSLFGLFPVSLSFHRAFQGSVSMSLRCRPGQSSVMKGMAEACRHSVTTVGCSRDVQSDLLSGVLLPIPGLSCSLLMSRSEASITAVSEPHLFHAHLVCAHIGLPGVPPALPLALSFLLSSVP